MLPGNLQASTMESKLPLSPSLILTLGLNQPVGTIGFDGFQIVAAENANDALHRLANDDVAVLILGARLSAKEALGILTAYAGQSPVTPAGTIILSADGQTELFQKFVDDGLIFYLVNGELAREQLGSLVAKAAGRSLIKSNRKLTLLSENAPSADRLLDFCVRLPMQSDLASASELLVNTISELIEVAHVRCLVYDPENETLTPANISDSNEEGYSAASGLTAFVARTGESLAFDRVREDARYDSDIDNPWETGNAHFLAQPIVGPDGLPVAVITAVRSGDSTPFSGEDLRLIEFLAECAAPTFSQILLQNRMQALLTQRATGTDSNSAVFRPEALEHHIRKWDQQGDVLKALPLWLRESYWIVLALCLAGIFALALLTPGLRTFFGKVN
jgi:hypothetical protein